jgi:hypothetical protein
MSFENEARRERGRDECAIEILPMASGETVVNAYVSILNDLHHHSHPWNLVYHTYFHHVFTMSVISKRTHYILVSYI